jgi:hypothetical protein
MADDNPLPEIKLKPHKPFTLSGWLLSCLISTAVVAGALGGLFVLLMGDGIFNPGEDPAIAFQKTHSPDASDDMKAINERLAKLETIAKTPAQAPDVTNLQKDVSKTAEQTAALEKKVDQIDQHASQDSNTGQIMLGITQLKSAYDDDQPLEPGIKTLQGVVKSDEVTKILNDLSAVAAQGVPSKEALIRSVNELAKPAPQPTLNQSDLSLSQRAKLALGQFVHVSPADIVAMQNNLHNIKQAIVVNDLATAASLVQQLPDSPASKILLAQIQLRLKAQQLTHDTVNTVTNLVTHRKEGLY